MVQQKTTKESEREMLIVTISGGGTWHAWSRAVLHGEVEAGSRPKERQDQGHGTLLGPWVCFSAPGLSPDWPIQTKKSRVLVNITSLPKGHTREKLWEVGESA